MIYISLFNSPFYGGGVEQVVKNLLDNFSSNTRNNITLICNDLNQKDEFYFDGIKCVNLKTKRHFILDKLFIFSRLTYSFKIYKFLKENISSGDIVNIHGVEYSFFASLFKKKIKNNFNLVITEHGSSFQGEYNEYIVKGLPWKFFYIKIFFFFWQYYFYFIEKFSVKGVDVFIHINEYFRDYYEKTFKIEKSKNFVIYNGINILEKNLKSEKNDSVFNAIIIGSTIYRKGLDLAIETIKVLNNDGYNIKLNIIGFSDFNKKYKNYDKNYINYIGRVEPEKVEKYIKQNDFLFLPSRSESFGLVVIDCLSMGLPFIIGKNATKINLKYSDFGYVSPDYKVNTLVNLCKKMVILQNYNKFVKNISIFDLSSYNWLNIAKEYEKIFNNL